MSLLYFTYYQLANQFASISKNAATHRKNTATCNPALLMAWVAPELGAKPCKAAETRAVNNRTMTIKNSQSCNFQLDVRLDNISCSFLSLFWWHVVCETFPATSRNPVHHWHQLGKRIIYSVSIHICMFS